ncbi:S-layer protein domain-containing protein [Methanolobus sp. WCC4]|uniref:S-layer protein domain-containing protein n=1 Tax=Methanolobus sp. WCC4 TaxID=3125784 RepID=UPI0030F810BA
MSGGTLNLKNVLMLVLLLVASMGVASANNFSETTAKPSNFVWDENTASSNTYTWDARTFSGFYYDLDSGNYSESMTINMDNCCDRIIEEGDLEYSTIPINIDFKHGDWGSYQVIGFIGEKYFSGYTSDTKFPGDEASLIPDGIITKILIDDNRNVPFNSSSPILLENGYILNLVEVDTSGSRAFITLEKDGELLDTGIVAADDDYVYEINLRNNDVPIIVVHFNNITHGNETNPVFVNGIFQVSEDYLLLEEGDLYSEMELTYYSDNGIGMENDNQINLSKGNIIQLMGDICLKVADDDNLRFAPFVNKETGNTYYLRGTVAENDTFTWTPLNFAGFYYNMDSNIGSEKLEVISLDDRMIEEGNLEYTSTIQEVDFKANYSDLDPAEFPAKYPVMGLFGEMYVPLRSDTPNKLTELLIDKDEKHLLTVEEPVEIGGGYAVSLEATNNTVKMMLLYLFKDSERIDSEILSVGDNGATLVYKDDISTEDDIDILRVHFSNMSHNQTTIDGIWLRDEENCIDINIGDSFGKLTVSEIGANHLKMENTENVTLFQNSVIEITENYAFRVADDNDLRYYPYTEITPLNALTFNSFSPATINPESYNGNITTFNVELNQEADVTWVLDDVILYTNTSVTTASYINTSAKIGIHNLKVTAKNENGYAEKQWTWIVTEHPFEFINIEPAGDCSVIIGGTTDFNVNMPYNCTIEWYLDNNLVQTDNNVTSSNYTFDSLINNISSRSSHSIKAVASNGNETCQKEWHCSVYLITLRSGLTWELKDGYSLTLSSVDTTGDKALLNLSKNEELVDQRIVPAESYYCYNRSINGIEQNIIKVYVSDIFQGQIDSLVVIEELQQYSDAGTLDTNPVKLLGLGDIWTLGSGYSLSIVGVDEKEDYCIISLDKDGTIVDERIINSNTIYRYQRTNETTDNIETIIEIPIFNVFNSIPEEYVEFSSNYTLYSDEGTVDTDSFVLIRSGELWELNNGYAIGIEEISDKKALVTIEKNGIVVDRDIIDENSIYNYERLESINGTIKTIITINSSKIFNGNFEDYIEFNLDYQVNSDTGTVALNDKSIVEAGSTLEWDNGYSISLVSTGINNKKAMFSLDKDGELYDEFILDVGDYYYLNRTIDGTELTIVRFQLENVFTGENNNIVTINRIIENPDISGDDISITTTEKDTFRIRSQNYNGLDLTDIIGYNDTDSIKINSSGFAGFFYDIDKGISTETLTIFGGSYINGTLIETNGTVYASRRMPIEYESSNIEGYYDCIGLFGERYVPISENTLNKTAKLVIDTNENIVLETKQSLYLPSGYEITPKGIDVEGEKVWIELSKNGEFLEDEVINVLNNEMWVYDKDLAGEDDVIVMKMKVTDIIQQKDGNGITVIEGLWLIDFENIVEINVGDNFGEMQVSKITADHLEMTNPNSIELERNSIVELTDKYSFMVADKDELEFCLVEEPGDSSTCEVRGTISENAAISEWTPVNFEGFYHGFSDNGGTETLVANISDSEIENRNLIYQTSPANVDFRHDEWGEYSAIGFLGEKYLASYTGSTGFELNATNLLSTNRLSRVLIDSNDEYVLYNNSMLILENGYELEVLYIDTNNSLLNLSLIKDGSKVDTAEVYANHDYIYRTDIQSINDVPIIAVHFNNISAENGSNDAHVEGLFQISDECTFLSIGDTFGQMTLSSISTGGITLLNGNDMLLSKGSSINVTENLYFSVADDDEVRFYPFMHITTPTLEFRTLSPGRDELTSESDTCLIFEVTTSKVSDLTWIVNDVEIQTNDSCMWASFSYTPTSTDPYTVTVQAENSDETIVQTWNMNANIPLSNTIDASSSGSSSSGGGGGGGGSTGEAYENILKKEVVRENVNKDMETTYNFKEDVNPVESIKFIALKNAGTISATIEVLKGRSSFVDVEPSGEVYKNINVWIGKTGFATPANIKDVQVKFKVEKTWIEENNIQGSSICLCRYNDNIWNELTTQKVDEDDKYFYFVSETSGFSAFAITGKALDTAGKTDVSYSLQDNTENDPAISESENSSSTEQKSTPGLGITASITVYALVALVLRRRN